MAQADILELALPASVPVATANMPAEPADTLPGPRHLRIFEAVARLRGFTKASEEVCLTQPAVTQAIAKLEGMVGRKLFERTPGQTELTDFGRKYLLRTRRFFQHIESALNDINVSENGTSHLQRIFRITRTQIRCHVSIARLHSFSRAAVDANISPTSLHRAARDLELNLGVQLYRNTRGGLCPTRAGLTLAKGFDLSIKEMQAAFDEMAGAMDSEPEVITIGVQMLDPAYLLAVVIEDFSKRFPGCAIRLVNSTYDDLIQRIRFGLVDVIVGVLKEAEADLATQALFADPYVIVARKGHPLAGQPQVGVAALRACRWILPNPGAPRRQAIDQFLGLSGDLTGGAAAGSVAAGSAAAGSTAIVESHSYAMIRATLCESDRLAVLTRSEVLADERLGVLDVIDTAPLPSTPVIGLAQQQGQALGQRRQALADLFRHHGETMAQRM